jgi:sodium/bile acid cotransporter 7
MELTQLPPLNEAFGDEPTLSPTAGVLRSTPSPPSRTPRFTLDATFAWVVSNFLPLSFAFALLIALLWPLPGGVVGSLQLSGVRAVQAANNVVVFLISGLTLAMSDVRATAKQPLALVAGLVLILGLTPCLAFGALHVPLHPPEFSVGLAIFCAVPTTLGVGVALTTASRGNVALALSLTVATNALGVVTVPYFLRALLQGSAVGYVDAADLATKLALTALAPAVAGAALRHFFTPVEAWVRRRKVGLSLFSHGNLACIVWQTMSSAAHTLLAQNPGSIFAVLAVAAAIHLLLLASMHVLATRVLRLPAREGVALVIMCSQKSAPVAVAVITYLTRSAAQQGLFALPALVGQLTQIFVGSALSRRFAKCVQLQEEAES